MLSPRLRKGSGLVSSYVDIDRIRKVRAMIPVSQHKVKLSA